MNYVRGEGNPNAKLVIVGEAPGKDEDAAGRPFVGQSGSLLNTFLKEAGTDRSEVYVTNVVKYRPPANDLKRLSEIGVNLDEQIKNLFSELEQFNPNCILALGDTALHVLTGKKGITKWRGSILPMLDGKHKVVGTFHPAYFLYTEGALKVYKYYQKYIAIFDIIRALAQSRFPERRQSNKHLHVVRSSSALYEFIQKHKDYPYISVDIESHNCVPMALGLAFTPNEAISIPILDIYNVMTRHGIPISELRVMWIMIAKLFLEKEVIGQNFKFDQAGLNRIGLYTKLHADTMLMSHTLNPEFPQSLAFNTSIYTEEPYYKDDGKLWNPKKDPFDQLLIYNARDAAVTLEIYDAMLIELEETGLKDFYFNFVHKWHNLYSEIENRGIRIDYDKRSELTKLYVERSNRLDAELETLIGAKMNVNSPKQVGVLLFDSLGFPKRDSTDEDTLVALLANHAKTQEKRRVIELILEIRRVRKTISTYLRARPDYDGRMRCSIRITGTETGRTSNSKMEAPVRPEPIGIAFQTLTKHGSVGQDLRTMFIPDPS